MIKFSDGVKFDPRGEYRLVKKADGWYVVGHGLLLPVDSEEEGKRVIEAMKDGTIE